MAKGTKTRRKSRGRRVIVLVVGTVLVLGIIVAAAPTLLSVTGVANSIARGALEDNTRGNVSIESVSLSWFGSQAIRGVRIEGDDDESFIELDLELTRNLLPLLMGSDDFGTLAISGRASGVRTHDGSISIVDLIDLAEPDEPGPPRINVRVIVEDLDIVVADLQTNAELAIEDASGTIDARLPKSIAIDLNAATRAAGQPGSMTIAGTVSGMFDPAGEVSFRQAEMTAIEAQLTAVPLTLVDGLLGMNGRLVSIAGDQLRSATLRANGTMDKGSARLAVESPGLDFNADLSFDAGMIVVAEDQPVVARISLSDAILATWLEPGDVQTSDGTPSADERTRVRIVSDAGGDAGYLELRLTSARLPVPGPGGFDPSRASVQVAISGGNTTLVFPDEMLPQMRVGDITGSITSNDLSETVRVVLDSTADVGEPRPAVVKVDVTHARPFASDGSFRFDPASVSGEIAASDIPTALVQGMVEGTPVDLPRDIGPLVSVNGAFGAGDDRQIEVTAQAANLSARIAGRVSADGAIAGRDAMISTEVKSKLLSAFAPPGGVAVPRILTVTLSSFSLPPVDDAGFRWDDFAVSGRLNMTGDPVGGFPAEESDSPRNPVRATTVELKFDSEALERGVKLSGGVEADGATIFIDQQITGLVDDSGNITAVTATPVGTMSIENVSSSLLARFVPDRQDLIDAATGGPLSAVVTTSSPAAGELVGNVRLEADHLLAMMAILKTKDSITLTSGSATIAVTESLAIALQPDAETPILARSEAIVARVSEPVIMLRQSNEGWSYSPGPIVVDLTSDAVVISQAPAIAEALTLGALDLTLRADLKTMNMIAAEGRATTALAATGARLANAEIDAQLERTDAGSPYSPRLEVTLAQIDLSVADAITDRDAGTLAGYLGETGNLRASATPTASGFNAVLSPEFPNLSGHIDVAADERMMRFTTRDLKVVLAQAGLETQLNQASSQNERSDDPRHFSVRSDVPLNVRVDALELPRALLTGQPLESTAVAVDITVNPAQHLIVEENNVVSGMRQEMRVRDVEVTLKGNDLEEGIALTMNAVIPVFSGDERTARGTVDVKGRVHDLLDREGAFAPATARLDIDGSITRFPMAFADLFVATEVPLPEMFGETLNAKVNSTNFSRRSGRIRADISTANGSKLKGMLLGGDNGFTTRPEEAIQLDLIMTQALRDDVLAFIHPIFADITSNDRPVRIAITNAFIPMTGVERLNADVDITVGEVTLVSSSQFLRILDFVNTSERQQMAGYLGLLDGTPMRIRIRDGQARYDNFVLHIGKDDDGYRQRLRFTGEIDLVRRYVDSLKALYPIDALGKSIRELRNLPNFVNVGVEFSGPIDNLKMDFDVTLNPGDGGGFDLGDLFRRGGDDGDKGKSGDPSEKLLRELFKGIGGG